MKMSIIINSPKIMAKVNNSQFGLFTASEWYRLLKPYTPQREGNLIRNVELMPFKIKYLMPYSHKVYTTNFNFRQDKSPYATNYWDVKAEQAGQKDKLYRALNNYLRRS